MLIQINGSSYPAKVIILIRGRMLSYAATPEGE